MLPRLVRIRVDDLQRQLSWRSNGWGVGDCLLPSQAGSRCALLKAIEFTLGHFHSPPTSPGDHLWPYPRPTVLRPTSARAAQESALAPAALCYAAQAGN